MNCSQNPFSQFISWALCHSGKKHTLCTNKLWAVFFESNSSETPNPCQRLSDDKEKITSSMESVLVNQLHNKMSRSWMEALPNLAEYLMRPAEWEVAMRMRYLIAPTSWTEVQCKCGESFRNTDFVVHSLNCKRVKGHTSASRHHIVKSSFISLLRRYGFSPDVHEPRFDNGRGPDICFLLGNELTLVDVTVVNPLAPSYVEKEAKFPGSTLQKAEAQKMCQHEDMASARSMRFFPLAFTCFGVPGNRTLSFLRKCGSFTKDQGGFVKHALMCLGITMQRGNAMMSSSAVHDWRVNGVR